MHISDVPNKGKLYFWDGQLWLMWDDPDNLPGPERPAAHQDCLSREHTHTHTYIAVFLCLQCWFMISICLLMHTKTCQVQKIVHMLLAASTCWVLFVQSAIPVWLACTSSAVLHFALIGPAVVTILVARMNVHCRFVASLISLHVLPFTWAESPSAGLYARGKLNMQFSVVQTSVFSHVQPPNLNAFVSSQLQHSLFSIHFRSAQPKPTKNAENSPTSIPGYHPRGEEMNMWR